MKRIVVANGRIIIIIYFRDLPPTTSAGSWTDKRKIPSRSTLGFLVIAIGTSMVSGKVASVGPAVVIALELMS